MACGVAAVIRDWQWALIASGGMVMVLALVVGTDLSKWAMSAGKDGCRVLGSSCSCVTLVSATSVTPRSSTSSSPTTRAWVPPGDRPDASGSGRDNQGRYREGTAEWVARTAAYSWRPAGLHAGSGILPAAQRCCHSGRAARPIP